MDHSEVIETVTRYQAELVVAEREAQAVLQRVESLRQAVQGLKAFAATIQLPQRVSLFDSDEAPVAVEVALAELGPVSDPVSAPNRQSAREAVRAVLIASRRAWKVTDLTADIVSRGWLADVSRPRDAVSTGVVRLVKAGEVERVGHGTYRYRLDKLPPAGEEPLPDEALEVGND